MFERMWNVFLPSADNWLRELKRWSPDIQVIMYYGSQEERREVRYSVFDGEEFNVMVTTYVCC